MHLRDGLETHVTVAQRYAHLVETGAIEADPAQRPVVAALDRLIDEISQKRLAKKSSALGWLFAKRSETRAPVRSNSATTPFRSSWPRSVIRSAAAKSLKIAWLKPR